MGGGAQLKCESSYAAREGGTIENMCLKMKYTEEIIKSYKRQTWLVQYLNAVEQNVKIVISDNEMNLLEMGQLDIIANELKESLCVNPTKRNENIYRTYLDITTNYEYKMESWNQTFGEELAYILFDFAKKGRLTTYNTIFEYCDLIHEMFEENYTQIYYQNVKELLQQF